MSGRPSEKEDAIPGGVQGHVFVIRELEVGEIVVGGQQRAVDMAGEGSQEGSQCSRRGGSGWQCPFPAHSNRTFCLKHIQQMRFGGKKGGKGGSGKSSARTKAATNSCSVEGRAASGKKVTFVGDEQAPGLNARRQQNRMDGRSQGRERCSSRQGKRVEVPMHLVEGAAGVVVQLGENAEEGSGAAAEQKGPILVDLEALEGGAVGWQNASLGGQQFGAAVECVQGRKSGRLAKHARKTAQELLSLSPRKVKNGGGDGRVKRRKVSGATNEPALCLSALSAQVRELQCSAEVVCSSDTASNCLPLPRTDCVVGQWSAADEERREQDGAALKRMRLHGSDFYAGLLRAAGGTAAFESCEWGGVLRHRWVGQGEGALLEVMPAHAAGRGSHDHVLVEERPFSWHSHAILGDSWPNLPSTADLLGVARESNLRPGGRGRVHLVVTPIGTWLLQATQELVRSLYDGSTRSEGEAVLRTQLEQIFDAHKCSVGYLPGVVPTDAPDFWMEGHEAAIRDALTHGNVEAQVRAYVEQLEKDARFVVGFVGHGADDACVPLHCKPASRRR